MLICGVDEAGRGPLAGPVVAAAVVLKDTFKDPRIQDSKVLTAKVRTELFDYIKSVALSWSIIAVGPRRIEKINILEATRLAMSLAVKRVKADKVLIDGNQKIFTDLPQQTVVKGDKLIVQISAASILAKTYRDGLMQRLALKYPGYGLDLHMGYPTKAHREALIRLGPSRIHRCTFHGVVTLASGASATPQNGFIDAMECGSGIKTGDLNLVERSI